MKVLSPDYVEPDSSDYELADRIFSSYAKMKRDEKKCDSLYLPSSMWRTHIDQGFAAMLDSLETQNLRTFTFFLANFGSWRTELGIESTSLVQQHASRDVLRRKLAREVFWPQFQAWQDYWCEDRPLSKLSYPRVGNQAGAILSSGEFIGPGSFFNDIYGSLLAGMTEGCDRPLLGELGGGYGKLAYFVLRDLPRFSYVDFDLPEVLATASFYLLKVFPDRPALLYGEDEYTASSHDRFDLIFMPSWMIETMGATSADLFINKNSLGEISSEKARNYVSEIARCTRGLMFHMNHEAYRNTFEEGSASLLNREYPIPTEFRRLIRYPELGHMISQPVIYGHKPDIFFYLYERVGRQAASITSMSSAEGSVSVQDQFMREGP